MEELERLWKLLVEAHPAFGALEGVAWIGLIMTIAVVLMHYGAGTDLGTIALFIGVVLSALVFMAGVYPYMDPEFDLEGFLKEFEKFERWTKGWGLILTIAALGLMVLANILLAVVY